MTRKMHRTAIVMVAWCVVWCSLAHSQASPDRGPIVTLDSVHPDANSTVSFDVKPADAVSWTSIANHSFANIQLDSGTYRAEVDRTSMKADVASRQFGFKLYVNRSSLFQQRVFTYEIVEDCAGVFNDTVRSVNISIGQGTSQIKGSILLPLHSPFGASNLLQSPYYSANQPYSLNPSAPPAIKLRTGSQTVFTISATSNLNFMLAHLAPASATVDCGPCLQSPIPVQLSTTDLAPNGQLIITVTANPNLWKAMSASQHPDSDKYDAILNINIPFTAGEQGEFGAPGQAIIPVEVRFSPPVPLTMLSVLAGTLIGAFIRMLLAWIPKKTWDWKQFVLGAIIAIVCWAVAMFAASSGNMIIKLFGLTFDPTQIFAAFLLCLLLSGGTGLLKLIEESIVGGRQ